MAKDHNQKDDVNEKLETWYENTVVDDREDNAMIAEVCIRECKERFNIGLGDVPTVLAIYAHTLDAITAQLKTLQEKKKLLVAEMDADIASTEEDYAESERKIAVEAV